MMNVVDYGIIGVFCVSCLIGIIRGLTKEILSFFSWLGSIAATFMFWPLARNIARHYINQPMMADAATIISLFILFLIMFSLISYFIANLVSASFLGGIDRSLGLLFGIARGIIFICIIEIALSCFVMRSNYPDIFKQSTFSPLVYRGSDILYQVLPEFIKNFITQQQSKHANIASPTEKITAEAIKENLPHFDSQSESKQKKVEDMATLKPKVSENSEETASYTKKNKIEMERLLKEGDFTNNDDE